MKGLYLIGPPGVGKSTVMRRVLSRWTILPPDALYGTFVVEPLLDEATGQIAGFHVGRTREDFPGTDALSMSVLPDAVKVVSRRLPFPLFGEGARLALPAFATAAAAGGNDIVWVHLRADDDVLAARRAGRTQDEQWVRGATTRATNAALRVAEAGIAVRTLSADAPPDELAAEILDWIQ